MVTICSIDIGVEHLSIIVIDPITKKIVYWAIHKVLELNGSFSHSISSLMTQALPFMTETVIIVIEKQIRCRNRVFQRNGMNNCLVEAGVEQLFINLKPDCRTLTFDPRHKLRRHGVDMATIVLKKSLKVQSVQICKQFLKSNVQHGDIHNFFYNHHGKKDDLSDCLLQALAYYNMHGSSFPHLVNVSDDSILDLTDDSIDLTDE
jgi:hypothetical protein